MLLDADSLIGYSLTMWRRSGTSVTVQSSRRVEETKDAHGFRAALISPVEHFRHMRHL